MAQVIRLKRSATPSQVPTTAQLELGEVAINTTDGKIFIKKFVDGTTANDLILELAPAVAGSAAPGLISSAAAPAAPVSGQTWYDTTNNVLKVWNGTEWVAMSDSRSAAPPADASNGDTWFDTDTNTMKMWNGSQWENIGVIRSAAQPANADVTAGDLWYDSDTSKMFMYTGSDWTGVGGGAAVDTTAPTNPSVGDLWYDSDTKTLSVYSGSVQGSTPGWNPLKGGAAISTTAPSGGNDGDLWYDSANTGRLYVYSVDAAAWIDAAPALPPPTNTQTFTKYKYVATAGQTDFTGADANGNTLATTSYMIVVMNGAILDTADYSSTADTITLTAPAALNDELSVLAFTVSSIAGTVSTTENSTINANLSVNGRIALDSELVVSGSITANTAIAATQTATLTADTTLNFKAQQNFVLTLGASITLLNPTTEAIGQSGFITFRQDVTGSRTVSLGSQFKTAGGVGITLSTAPNAIDTVPYIVIAADTILLGQPQLAFA